MHSPVSRLGLVAALMSAASAFSGMLSGNAYGRSPFRGSTPSRRHRAGPDCAFDGINVSPKRDDEPRNYPGAKLARKAYRGELGKCHP